MHIFQITIDAQIEADSAEDVLLQLARHFDKEHGGEDSGILMPGSTVSVELAP